MDDKLIAAIAEVEGLGDRLLQVKGKLVQLDKSRNKLREGARSIKGCEPGQQVWLTLPGDVDIRLPAARASEIIQTQQKELDEEIERLRRQQKALVGLITEKTGTPKGYGPGLLKTFLDWDQGRGKEGS